MLKLTLQYFGHLMQRADSLENYPNAGKDWGQEKKGTTKDEMAGWRRWLNVHELEQALGDSGGQEAWRAAARGSQRVGHDLATEQQQTLGPWPFLQTRPWDARRDSGWWTVSRCWATDEDMTSSGSKAGTSGVRGEAQEGQELVLHASPLHF